MHFINLEFKVHFQHNILQNIATTIIQQSSDVYLQLLYNSLLTGRTELVKEGLLVGVEEVTLREEHIP